MNLGGQLQYNYSKTITCKKNKYVIASCIFDWKVSKKFRWSTFISSNRFKYGNEITPNNANYLESIIRTGFQYRFGK
jgi:hypothetical protein